MKIGIFDPYLSTLGGGEKYILDIASCLAREHSVNLFWDDNSILNKAEERFGKSFEKTSIVKNIFGSHDNLISRYFKTRNYDVIFYISDGSIPFLFSKKNILIFQFPTPWVRKNFIHGLKLKKINKIICYSNFVKSFLDPEFGISAQVLPPYIDIPNQNTKKENIILSVGRFTRGMNTKKQEVLIDIFKEAVNKNLKGWKLVLIGSSLPSDMEFTKSIKEQIKNYPIEIIVNARHEELLSFYKKAKIYWHAAGFGEDLVKHPEKAEHFGISTVEAMASGAVPVVYASGGQKEIVENSKNGFLWNTKEELIKRTIELVDDDKLWEKMSNEAEASARRFSEDRFCKEVKGLI